MFRNLIGISSTLLIVLLFGYSCGSDDDDDDDKLTCSKACEAVAKCGGSTTFDTCYQLYCNQDGLIFVPSSKCLKAIDSAPCEQHDTLGLTSYYKTCFPPCSQEGARCSDDDTLRICGKTVGGELVSSTVTCDSMCEYGETPSDYSGYCGTTYPGTDQVTSTGQNACWCE
jgi:hypothetical protein